MAGIGKSTEAHFSRAHVGIDAIRHLTNWGNWVSSLPQPGNLETAMQPMFRDYVAGYRSASSARTAEAPDIAERMDGVIATMCDTDKSCLILAYVSCLSNSKASKFMSRYDQANGGRTGLSCTDKTFKIWLEIAEKNLEKKIAFAEGFSFSG